MYAGKVVSLSADVLIVKRTNREYEKIVTTKKVYQTISKHIFVSTTLIQLHF